MSLKLVILINFIVCCYSRVFLTHFFNFFVEKHAISGFEAVYQKPTFHGRIKS